MRVNKLNKLITHKTGCEEVVRHSDDQQGLTHKCCIPSQNKEDHDKDHQYCFLERDHRLIDKRHPGVCISRDNLKSGKPDRIYWAGLIVSENMLPPRLRDVCRYDDKGDQLAS